MGASASIVATNNDAITLQSNSMNALTFENFLAMKEEYEVL